MLYVTVMWVGNCDFVANSSLSHADLILVCHDTVVSMAPAQHQCALRVLESVFVWYKSMCVVDGRMGNVQYCGLWVGWSGMPMRCE